MWWACFWHASARYAWVASTCPGGSWSSLPIDAAVAGCALCHCPFGPDSGAAHTHKVGLNNWIVVACKIAGRQRRTMVVYWDVAAQCWCIGRLGFRNDLVWFLRPACVAGPVQPAFKALGCMPNSALPRCVLLVPSAWFPAWVVRIYLGIFNAVAVRLVGHIPRISAADWLSIAESVSWHGRGRYSSWG